jgi:hypothetical protein
VIVGLDPGANFPVTNTCSIEVMDVELTVCGLLLVDAPELIVYVPVNPVPVPKAEIVVPAVMPVALIGKLTARCPDDTSVTVIVVPETVAAKETDPEEIAVAELTVCGVTIVYIPIVPVPQPGPTVKAEMVVPAVRPVPLIVAPAVRLPDDTEDTVIVVPETFAVNTTDPDVIVVSELAVCGVRIVYVPVLPVPDPELPVKVEMVVPAVRPVPLIAAPAVRLPDGTEDTEDTVIVVPETVAVNTRDTDDIVVPKLTVCDVLTV